MPDTFGERQWLQGNPDKQTFSSVEMTEEELLEHKLNILMDGYTVLKNDSICVIVDYRDKD